MSNVTVFVCNCCGHIARSRQQPTIVPNRPPVIQVECTTDGCRNKDWTYSYRDGDAQSNAQVLERYTPVVMDESQVARFVEAVNFTAQ